MIGVFAKMFGPKDRVTEVSPHDDAPAYEVKARSESGPERAAKVEDAPPAAFCDRVPHEGGDVYVIPFMEAFRSWLGKRRTSPPEAESR